MAHTKSSCKVKGKRRVFRSVLLNGMSQEDTKDLVIRHRVKGQEGVGEKVHGCLASNNTFLLVAFGRLLGLLGCRLVGKKRRCSLAVYERRSTGRGYWGSGLE